MVAWLLPALTAVGSIGGAVAANSAARAQQRAGRRQVDAQLQMYDQTREDLAPYREQGLAGQNALMYYLGLGARPDDPNFVGFQQTPGYQFAVNEAQRGIEASAAARGGLYSGATMQALQDRRQGMADLEFGNYLARLGGVAAAGQGAAGMQAGVNQQTANGLAAAYGGIGDAQAAGAIGMGNALTGGINQFAGLWGYQQGMGAFAPQAAMQPGAYLAQ